MKKLFSSVSLSALIICSAPHFAYGMEVEEKPIVGMRAKRIEIEKCTLEKDIPNIFAYCRNDLKSPASDEALVKHLIYERYKGFIKWDDLANIHKEKIVNFVTSRAALQDLEKYIRANNVPTLFYHLKNKDKITLADEVVVKQLVFQKYPGYVKWTDLRDKDKIKVISLVTSNPKLNGIEKYKRQCNKPCYLKMIPKDVHFLIINYVLHQGTLAPYFLDKYFLKTVEDFMQSIEILDASTKNCCLTNAQLKKFNNLTSLNLSSNAKITDQGLYTNQYGSLVFSQSYASQAVPHFTNLTDLDLSNNDKISVYGCRHFVNTTSLNLASNNRIDISLLPFTKLTTLDLTKNVQVTDSKLRPFTQLSSLNLSYNTTILGMGGMGGAYSVNPNLTDLNLCVNNKFSGLALGQLTNLTRLNLSGAYVVGKWKRLELLCNQTIKDENLTNLTNLRSLNLSCNKTITNAGLSSLPNLTELDLTYNITITDAGVCPLKNITYLNLSCASGITSKAVNQLTNLTTLNLSLNIDFDDKNLKGFPKLKNIIRQ